MTNNVTRCNKDVRRSCAEFVKQPCNDRLQQFRKSSALKSRNLWTEKPMRSNEHHELSANGGACRVRSSALGLLRPVPADFVKRFCQNALYCEATSADSKTYSNWSQVVITMTVKRLRRQCCVLQLILFFTVLHLLRIVLTLACSPPHLSGVSVQDAWRGVPHGPK